MATKKQTEFESPEYKSKAGAPTKYKTSYDEQARKLCLLGFTDEELADFFDVATSTLYLWKKEFPKFSEAINKGKVIADAEVASSLYKRANGYDYTEEEAKVIEGKIHKVKVKKHQPSETMAGMYWQNNRQRTRWKARQSEEEAPAVIISVSTTPEEEIRIARNIRAMVMGEPKDPSSDPQA